MSPRYTAGTLAGNFARTHDHQRETITMKQTDFVVHASSRGISAKLSCAVIRQIGGWGQFKERAGDVARHGAAGGFAGFTYYTDTEAFTNRNRADILALCESMRDSMGEPDTLAGFIAGFNCLDLTPAEVEAVLMGIPCDEADPRQVLNALAWFALEETARAYVDALEEDRQ